MKPEKIFVGSDFHIDTHPDIRPFTLSKIGVDIEQYDYYLLPGDFATAEEPELALPLLEELSEAGKQVVMCLGNHDYYGAEISKAEAIWRDLLCNNGLYGNVRFLTPDSPVYIPQIKTLIVGGTLWTDVADDPKARKIADTAFKDSDNITIDKDVGYTTCFYSEDQLPIYYRTISEAIRNVVKYTKRHGHDITVIFMSHHAPSAQCVHEKFKNRGAEFDMFNRGFYSDLDWLLSTINAKYAVHGHMHDYKNFEMKGLNTTLVCNPYGSAKPNGIKPGSRFSTNTHIKV